MLMNGVGISFPAILKKSRFTPRGSMRGWLIGFSEGAVGVIRPSIAAVLSVSLMNRIAVGITSVSVWCVGHSKVITVADKGVLSGFAVSLLSPPPKLQIVPFLYYQTSQYLILTRSPT